MVKHSGFGPLKRITNYPINEHTQPLDRYHIISYLRMFPDHRTYTITTHDDDFLISRHEFDDGLSLELRWLIVRTFSVDRDYLNQTKGLITLFNYYNLIVPTSYEILEFSNTPNIFSDSLYQRFKISIDLSDSYRKLSPVRYAYMEDNVSSDLEFADFFFSDLAHRVTLEVAFRDYLRERDLLDLL